MLRKQNGGLNWETNQIFTLSKQNILFVFGKIGEQNVDRVTLKKRRRWMVSLIFASLWTKFPCDPREYLLVKTQFQTIKSVAQTISNCLQNAFFFVDRYLPHKGSDWNYMKIKFFQLWSVSSSNKKSKVSLLEPDKGFFKKVTIYCVGFLLILCPGTEYLQNTNSWKLSKETFMFRLSDASIVSHFPTHWCFFALF